MYAPMSALISRIAATRFAATRFAATVPLAMLLTACMPPTFYSAVNVYAVDNGSDVTFVVKVANNPSSVTCFDGNVVMALVDNDTFQGSADYTNDLGGTVGTTTVSCRASNEYGTFTSTVGTITLIVNQPPQVVMLGSVSICGNDGTLQIDEPLVDAVNSLYLTGATYALTQGTLPAGLGINATNGNLQGNTAAGDFSPTGLAVTATTAAGSDESSTFSVVIVQAACP